MRMKKMVAKGIQGNQRSYPKGRRTPSGREPFLGRKGEMTTQQIVILIIAIASFAVILYFLGALSLGENTSDELCRNSVAQRGSVEKVSGVSVDAIPLQCERSYVCLTADGSCEALYKPEAKRVKTQDDVYEVLAEELATCWWMFGEGKVNYAGEDTFEQLYCSFCSQIAFDDSVKEIFPEGNFDEGQFYQELKRLNVTKDRSYFEYLFGVQDSSEFFEQNFGNISLDDQYYSLIAISGDVSTLGWVARIGGGAALVAGGIALAPFTGGTSLTSVLIVAGSAGAVGSAAGGFVVAPIIRGQSNNDFIPPTLVEVNSEEFRSLNCDEITTSS